MHVKLTIPVKFEKASKLQADFFQCKTMTWCGDEIRTELVQICHYINAVFINRGSAEPLNGQRFRDLKRTFFNHAKSF